MPTLASVPHLPHPVPGHPLEADRRPHDVAGETLHRRLILGLDGDSVVDRKARVPPRQQQLGPLLGEQTLVLEKPHELVAEEQLGRTLINVRNRDPLPIPGPPPARNHGVKVRLPSICNRIYAWEYSGSDTISGESSGEGL